jgi:membrane dipeptidase
MNVLIYNRDMKKSVAEVRAWEEGMTGKTRGKNTVCFPDLRRGEVFLSFSTILARHASGAKTVLDWSPEGCYAAAWAQDDLYRLYEQQGILRRIKTKDDLQAHLAEWQTAPETAPLGHLLSMEGADPMLTPDQVFRWWETGLRVMSLAHYGLSAYAHGTHTPGGLLPPARPLLKNMRELGMILDLTHLADESFWEVLDIFDGRVIATHNNCRALVPDQRQFSDDQIRAIIERDGVIGSAMDSWMLMPGWDKANPTPEKTTLSDVVDHMDHICQLAGNARHIAIGTDLDGGFGKEQSPWDLDTIADLQKIPGILRRRGYSEADVEAVMRGNWLRLLNEALPA